LNKEKANEKPLPERLATLLLARFDLRFEIPAAASLLPPYM
jgi:hypothetical protein